MSGQLVICKACSKSTAITARSCPGCGAALVSTRTGAVGCLGWFFVVDGLLGCPFSGGWSLILTGVGAVLVMLGRSEQTNWGTVRLATSHDAERLGIPHSSFADRYPPTLSPLTMILVGTVVVVALAFAAQSLWGSDIRGPTSVTDSREEPITEPMVAEPDPRTAARSVADPEAPPPEAEHWHCLCAREFDALGTATIVTSCRVTASQCERLEGRAGSGQTLELTQECVDLVGPSLQSATGTDGWEPSSFRGGWQLRGRCALE